MNWLLRNWYGLVSWITLGMGILELILYGQTLDFWALLILTFVTQTAQAILNEIRKSEGWLSRRKPVEYRQYQTTRRNEL